MEEWSRLLQGELGNWVEQVFGGDYHPEEAVQMHGGAQKVVYLIRCSNGFRFILYVWDLQSNYFREEIERQEPDKPISGYGGKQFQAAHDCLRQLQVPTPELYHFEAAGLRCKDEFAFVEYIEGAEASEFFQAESKIQGQIFESLADMLNRMHRHTRGQWGTVYDPMPEAPAGCHGPLLAEIVKEVDYLSLHVAEFHRLRDKMDAVLADMVARIAPRSSYGFIHAELGPNHVLVDHKLQPYLIDIDGARFFDVEYEHSFMEFRFDNYERYLRQEHLDRNRMVFYKLCHHISYSAGPHRLLQRGYPDGELVKQIMNSNTQKALRMVNEYR